jgi:UDP-N-acetylmuramoyl-L-alanyl-D-glutamate--2,6-diaminopimelate ligase
MDFKCLVAVIAAKVTRIACRLIKHAGTSLPGRVALKIDPQILAKLSVDKFIIMVTGTNGKTTTTAMISHILNEAGIKHIVNGHNVGPYKFGGY